MQTRNLLDNEAVDKYIRYLGRNKAAHIQAWLGSTFKRYLMNEAKVPLKRVLSARDVNNPLVEILATLMCQIFAKPNFAAGIKEALTDNFHIVEVGEQTPDWLVKALTNHTEVYHLEYKSLYEWKHDKHIHMLDFMETLPERQIKHTIKDMVDAVKAWDKMLANQKLRADLYDGVEILQSPVLEAFEHTKLHMVKLVTKPSYAAEGAIMKHCVGGRSYYGREGTAIYSLRRIVTDDSDEGVPTPIATIEVKTTKSKKKKKEPDQPILDFIMEGTAAYPLMRKMATFGSNSKAKGRPLASAYEYETLSTVRQIQGPCNQPVPEPYNALIDAWITEQGFVKDTYETEDEEWDEVGYDDAEDDEEHEVAEDDEEEDDEPILHGRRHRGDDEDDEEYDEDGEEYEADDDNDI